MIAESTFEFLKQLTLNNNREWFNENRETYETARENFIKLADEVLNGIKNFEPLFYDTQIKDCIFRINRDVRFSADKSPYKKHFAAAFGQGGKNSGKNDYYLHLQNDETFVAAGLWQPESAQLAQIRQEIDYSPSDLLDIINEKSFKKHFPEIYGQALKKAPKGYPADHENIQLLKQKEFIFMKKFTNEEVLSKSFKDEVIESCRILKPFLDYLNGVLYNQES